MQPSLRTLGRRAFTRIDEHSGFNLLQAAVLEDDDDTVKKASVYLESFVEGMKSRRTSENASFFPGKSAADILPIRKHWNFWRPSGSVAVVMKAPKGSTESSNTKKTFERYTEFVGTEKTLTKLHSCAKGNDVEMAIELVLNAGMDVNVVAERNITPLLWASTAASSLSIKTLIDLGADVNAQTFQESTFGVCSGTAIHFAIHGNNANVVKVLLANKVDANIADLQGNTVLHSSSSNISQLLIDSGCKINLRNNVGETPLHSNVRGKNVPDVKLLLKNNADANIKDNKGNTPLHISTGNRLCDISQLLVDSGCKINVRNNVGETPLHSSVRSKNVADVELLLKNNADVNIEDNQGNTPIHLCTGKGLCDISPLLVYSGCKINARNNVGETPLHSAVRGKNVADVKLLLKSNADANIEDNQGNTPIHLCTGKGLCDISPLLVYSGCKINARNNVGETPLHSAVRGKNVADVKLLLKSNADANIKDNKGNTPLHISTHNRFHEISQLLVDSGCKVNVRNSVGETPLHSAVIVKNVADVELLLKNNADTNVQNPSGNTPLHISSRRGFSNISHLLIDSGSNKKLKNRDGKTPLDFEPFYHFSHYPPYVGDRKQAKGDKGHAYAPQKDFRFKRFYGSVREGDQWMNQPTQSTLSSPLPGKLRSGSPLKNRPELSSARRKRQMGHVSSPFLYGNLEADKRDTGYASQESSLDKSIVESEYEEDALVELETLYSPIVDKGKEQSST